MTVASALVPEETTLETAKPDRRILWLVMGHVVLGLLVAFSAGQPHNGMAVWEQFLWAHVLTLVIFFSHTTLTGIWIGLGLNSMWQRFFGFVGGASYFLVFSWLIGQFTSEFIFMLVFTLVVATVPLLIMRLCGFSIQPTASSAAVARRPQFSISKLLAITTIVAISLPITTQCGTHLRDSVSFLGFLCINTAVGMLQVWSFLATNRPFVAVGITAVASFAQYLIGPLLLDELVTGVYISFSVAPMVVALTLLIVRSFGYRLVTRPSLHRRATPTIGVESFITRAAD